MARIYAPHSFKASSINAAFYRYLESLADDAVVLLEFVSQGPSARQVDCAILSSGGVDLLEVKDKQGKIKGHAAQPWVVTNSKGYEDTIENCKGGQRENPFEQAANTATDFKQWLSQATGKITNVYPLVVIPQGHPNSAFEKHHQTYVANGVEEIGNKLRAYNHRRRIALTQTDIDKVVKLLNLGSIGLAQLEGRIIDQKTRKGIAGAAVHISGEQLAGETSIRTNDRGRYQAILPVGTLTIRIDAPEPYKGRDFTFTANQGVNRVEEVELAATASVGREETTTQHILEILEKERRDREALYELLVEQLGQSTEAGKEKELQRLSDELKKIQELLNKLSKNHTTEEQQDVIELAQHLLPILAAQTQAASPRASLNAKPVRPAEKWPSGNQVGLLVASAVLALVAGGWFLHGRQPAPTASTPVVASKPTTPTTGNQKEGSTATSTKAGKTAPGGTTSQQAGQNQTQKAPQSNNLATARPAQSSTPAQPQSRVSQTVDRPAQAKTSDTRTAKPVATTSPKPPATRPPTSPSAAKASPTPANTSNTQPPTYALPGVPIQARTQPTPQPEPETLPGIPIRQDTAEQQSTGGFPGEALPGQPISRKQGAIPSGKNCPESHPIKGNISSRMIYHLPGQEFYEQTRPEACFATPEEAAQAGFRPSLR
jgi:hypothetical protein